MQCDSSLWGTWQIELAMHRAMLKLEYYVTVKGGKILRGGNHLLKYRHDVTISAITVDGDTVDTVDTADITGAKLTDQTTSLFS